MYSTPAGLTLLKPYARQLGQNGRFPNAKVGTLIQPSSIGILFLGGVGSNPLEQSIKEAKQGKVDFRVNSNNCIDTVIGSIDLEPHKIKENL